MPGGLVIGNAEPRALDSFGLRRLVEIGERQGPLDRLRQPPDPHRLPAGVGSSCRGGGDQDENQRQQRGVVPRFGLQQPLPGPAYSPAHIISVGAMDEGQRGCCVSPPGPLRFRHPTRHGKGPGS
jgi:hypothetical protein